MNAVLPNSTLALSALSALSANHHAFVVAYGKHGKLDSFVTTDFQKINSCIMFTRRSGGRLVSLGAYSK